MSPLNASNACSKTKNGEEGASIGQGAARAGLHVVIIALLRELCHQQQSLCLDLRRLFGRKAAPYAGEERASPCHRVESSTSWRQHSRHMATVTTIAIDMQCMCIVPAVVRIAARAKS